MIIMPKIKIELTQEQFDDIKKIIDSCNKNNLDQIIIDYELNIDEIMLSLAKIIKKHINFEKTVVSICNSIIKKNYEIIEKKISTCRLRFERIVEDPAFKDDFFYICKGFIKEDDGEEYYGFCDKLRINKRCPAIKRSLENGKILKFIE